jgi:hypothetical protein
MLFGTVVKDIQRLSRLDDPKRRKCTVAEDMLPNYHHPSTASKFDHLPFPLPAGRSTCNWLAARQSAQDINQSWWVTACSCPAMSRQHGGLDAAKRINLRRTFSTYCMKPLLLISFSVQVHSFSANSGLFAFLLLCSSARWVQSTLQSPLR